MSAAGRTNRTNDGGSGSGSSSASSPTRVSLSRENRPLLPRSQSALLLLPAPPPLHITIRFSTALPDLHLDIPSPQQTTVVALKHLIRGRLAADAEATADDDAPNQQRPSPAAQASVARLRFIHNGRILPDASVLSAVVKAPPPPPLSYHVPPPDPKGKSVAGLPSHRQQQRVFINCSIGDELSPADLEAEASAAAAPPPSPSPTPTIPSPLPLPPSSPFATTQTSHSPSPPPPPPPRLATTTNPSSANPNPSTTTTTGPPPPPLGFDRLLTAGLTPAEIATLRSHFRAIHTARFPPDAMPSPDTLRAMEDAWLDSTQSLLPPASASSGGLFPNNNTYYEGDDDDTAAANLGGAAAAAAVDDAFGLSAVAGPLVRGMLVGFVFPLGVIGWLGKEDGVWSRRMQVFVVFGVLLSLSVGVVRGLTGEG